MAAFVISFFVVGSSELVEIITEISASFVLLLFLVVLFLLLVGSFFQEKQEAVFLEGGWKTVFMIIVFLGLAFIFLDAFGWLEETSDFFSGSSSGELVGSVVLLVIVVLFIVYITQDRKIEKKSS
jgi:Ca2+/Na+ antiporter